MPLNHKTATESRLVESKKQNLAQRQTSALLDDLGDGAGFVSGHDEDVLQAVQDHLHHLGVFHRQQVAEGRDDILLNQELHLHKPTHTHHIHT